jgi:exonuclease VII small subunit
LNRKKTMEEKIKSLETEVQELESQQSALTRRNGW